MGNLNKNLKKIHVMVGILINSQNQICISKRLHHKHLGGYWEFPGGKKNQDESCLEALAREFDEELGVKILNAEPWFYCEHEYPEIRVYLDIWSIKKYSGDPYSREGQEVKLISVDQLAEYVFPEANQEIVARLLEKYSKI